MEKIHIEIVTDGVPYEVTATPYTYNNMTRFYVSYNGSEQYVFAWDETLGRLASIGDESIDIPDNLEIAIAEKLQPAMAL
jgi:hypothetical protein